MGRTFKQRRIPRQIEELKQDERGVGSFGDGNVIVFLERELTGEV